MADQEQRLFLSPPHMSGRERELVQEAFDSNYIAPLGPMVDAFEREFAAYTGIPHCLAVSSGTAAMHLALTCLKRKWEDQANRGGTRQTVFASSLTFIGGISPALFEGLEPVFIDCEPESWTMDPGLLEEALESYAASGNLPLAAIPTDMYGQCCQLRQICEICDRFDVPVICDSAEAVGAWYWPSGERRGKRECKHDGAVHAGYDASAAVYSFNGNKIITSSGGGMLASHDKDLIDYARKLATQAREPAPHYQHQEIGYNYRMSNIVAAIGRGQLQVLDERVDQARSVFARYKELLGGLPGIDFMPEAGHNRCNRWLTVILIDEETFEASPEEIRQALENRNIEARPTWKPMHLQPIFQENSAYGGEVSEDLFARGLCLPSGTDMSDENIERVVSIIRECGT